MRKFVLALLATSVFIFAAAQQDSALSFGFQTTSISQVHPQFHSPYVGDNSLEPKEPVRSTLTATLYFNLKLGKGTQIIFNPEVAGGEGFSGATGLAGFSNGESFRVGNPKPTVYLARLVVEQILPFKASDYSAQKTDSNLAPGYYPTHCFKVYGGRFCLADYFDGNPYNHDPRGQFINWSFMSGGAWDYAADTRGYTWGVGSEWRRKNWRAALAFALMPRVANGIDMDEDISRSFALQTEATHLHKINKLPGQLQLTLFLNRAHMGSYREALKTMPVNPDITAVRSYKNYKGGFVLNAAQQLSKNWGSFLRASYNDGKNETWAYTEIDRSLNLGVVWSKSGFQKQNQLGVGVAINGISKPHRDYLAAGGYGFIIGDGKLNYASEIITEAYYRFSFFQDRLQVSPDYQFAVNPAYNKDRGPVHIFSLRTHVAF
ncbi:carbohydrate porin [Flavisolibacter ginsenosidimutans]|nr:carbohydrate porin [Flavisolibacter ginsenosidimutans]